MVVTAISALLLLFIAGSNAESSQHGKGLCTGLVHAPEGVLLRQQLCDLLKRYEQAHREATASTEAAVASKFLLIDLESHTQLGLGNRLPDIVTGFVLAMFLNRTLLFSLPANSEETFQDRLGFFYRSSAWLFYDPRMTTDYIQFSYDESFSGKFWEASQGATVVHYPITWGSYWLAHFQANPHMLPFLEQHFPDYEAFHPISQYLFQLSDNAQVTVNQVQQKQFKQLTIGIQVRMLKHEWAMWGAAYGQPQIEDYITLAKLLQRVSGVPENETTFFIASDKPEVYEQASASLPGNVYHTDNGIGTEFTNHRGMNPGSELSATVDMKLLSLCDILIVTWGSSFGYGAAGWGGIKPYLMTGRELFDDAIPWYFIQASTEPCHWPANDITYNPEQWQAFQRNPLWMHHTQCHPCAERKNCRNPLGDRVKAEKVQFVRSILLNSTWAA